MKSHPVLLQDSEEALPSHGGRVLVCQEPDMFLEGPAARGGGWRGTRPSQADTAQGHFACSGAQGAYILGLEEVPTDPRTSEAQRAQSSQGLFRRPCPGLCPAALAAQAAGAQWTRRGRCEGQALGTGLWEARESGRICR